jgi:CHASE2 domain-containing sensor protein
MGHIQLPDDVRRIPLSVPLKGGGRLDSFAEAIVRADNEKALEDVAEQDEFPYGSYIKADKFPQLSADRVLGSDPKTLESEIGHKIVIVGGIWHRFGFGAGAQTDTYFTPEGDLPGVFIHANYVEALLCSQMFKPVKEVVKKSIDALVSLVVAIAFALRIRFRRKLGIAAGLCVLLAILSYVFLQNLGMFCDFLIPVLFVMAHFAGEQILEWRKDARKYAKSLSNLVTPTNGG